MALTPEQIEARNAATAEAVERLFAVMAIPTPRKPPVQTVPYYPGTWAGYVDDGTWP